MADLQDLERRIRALEDWKKQKESQQISYPLDNESVNVLAENFMNLQESIVLVSLNGVNTATYYTGVQGDKRFVVSENTFIPYTVNTTADTLTVQRVTFQDDQLVRVYTSEGGTVPSPLDSTDIYYVVNSTGLTFELSATQGGSAINITTIGSGVQYVEPVIMEI